MKRSFIALAFFLSTLSLRAEVQVHVDHNDAAGAESEFRFHSAPPPRRGDLLGKAHVEVIDGIASPNGENLEQWKAGALPAGEDDPAHSFFFRDGENGGRILVDFDGPREVKEIDTYSWHPSTRAPQVYKVYGSDGSAAGFERAPKRPRNPESAGWKLLANVDTRLTKAATEGQNAVVITDSTGVLGRFRYLLFDIERTENQDPFGNTFFSAMTIVSGDTGPLTAATSEETGSDSYIAEGGGSKFSIDTADAPDLRAWSKEKLAPAMQKWYPIIAQFLSSPGYHAPKRFTLKFSKSFRGVAATGGNHIEGSVDWYRANKEGEGVGSIIHELVHVAQQYHGPRAAGAESRGWLVEGIADYVRWFRYEPQTHGAEIDARRLSGARYDGSYRVTANFLNWVAGKYGEKVIQDVNAKLREGEYKSDLWKTETGQSLEELGEAWKKDLAVKLGAQS